MSKFQAYLLTLIILSFINAAAAETPAFIPSNEIINLNQVIHQLGKISTIPVMFPAKIPVDSNESQYYASLMSDAVQPNYNRYWQINIDITPDCQGIKICNIGYISAARAGRLTQEYFTLPDNQPHPKIKIKFKNNITAYYTPFHIQAGGVNPTLEWQSNGVLYTLSWHVSGSPAQQKRILIRLLQEGISED